MESQESVQQADFPIVLRTDAELLEFAYMLAAQCANCATKATLALMAAKIFCSVCFDEYHDERYMEPRYILSYAIDALAEAETDIAQAEQNAEMETTMKERAAARHVH